MPEQNILDISIWQHIAFFALTCVFSLLGSCGYQKIRFGRLDIDATVYSGVCAIMIYFVAGVIYWHFISFIVAGFMFGVFFTRRVL